MAVLLGAHVQAALHLPPAEGGLGHRGSFSGVPLGGVGQVGAPVEGFAQLHFPLCAAKQVHGRECR